MKIKSASIQFNEHGTPVSSHYDDVYFSNDDGAAETHYVFIEGNQLLKRFEECQNDRFYIAETGFGTGLNCAVAIACFQTFKQLHPNHVLQHLHIISVEKYPLSFDDLNTALEKQPSSSCFKEQLINQYPLALAGVHRMSFGDTTIDLHFGDATDLFADITKFQCVLIDAWFLDGFAPSKNPKMWSQDLFNRLASLSRPNTTLATFTAAGFVRRGLIDAGFVIQKIKGFGRKRDMLVGYYPQNEKTSETTTSNISTSKINTSKPVRHIAIVGAGLAGANMALSLAKRGIHVTVFDSSSVASGASGNPQGGFYPQLHAQISEASLIQALSFDYARRRYCYLSRSGFRFEHDLCGVLLLAFADAVNTRQQKMQANAPWPSNLVQHVDSEKASDLAGLPLPFGGLFIEQGGWISPPGLVAALLNCAESLSYVDILEHQSVSSFTSCDGKVVVHSHNKQHQFDHAVICSGDQSNLLSPFQRLPFGKTRGQVESVASSSVSKKLKTVLCHKGYFTPAMNGRHALGSTYVRNDTALDYRHEESDLNFSTHKKALMPSTWLDTLNQEYVGRAAVRMTLPDHQPVIGTLEDGEHAGKVSILSGLGSRGLTTGPLMAEVLCSCLFGEPMPIAHRLYKALHYRRFELRKQR
jgi:tRNA 5-methylaminomethyl-2-thiouridine biosynthesis bifunctional protein